jgi:hypothetical protein
MRGGGMSEHDALHVGHLIVDCLLSAGLMIALWLILRKQDKK